MFVSDIDSMLKRWMALCVYYINDVVFFAKNYRHAWKINGNITAETHDFTPIISIYTFALIPFSLPLCHFLSHALSFLHCYHERYIRSYIYIFTSTGTFTSCTAASSNFTYGNFTSKNTR